MGCVGDLLLRGGSASFFGGAEGVGMETKLANIIRLHGRISMAELALILGTSERMARKLVEDARRAGVPILSSTHPKQGGYWLGAGEEVNHWAKQRKTHIRKQGRLIEAVLQPKLWEIDL